MDYAVLAIPGGFSYGDDVGAGRILANQIRPLPDATCASSCAWAARSSASATASRSWSRRASCPTPTPATRPPASPSTTPAASRRAGRTCASTRSRSCPSSQGLPEMIELPVAHGEGKLVLKSPRQLEELKKNKSIALQYVNDDGKLLGYPHNPNGSIFNIAALTNPEGNCLGLMPHPEQLHDALPAPQLDPARAFIKEGVGLGSSATPSSTARAGG